MLAENIAQIKCIYCNRWFLFPIYFDNENFIDKYIFIDDIVQCPYNDCKKYFEVI